MHAECVMLGYLFVFSVFFIRLHRLVIKIKSYYAFRPFTLVPGKQQVLNECKPLVWNRCWEIFSVKGKIVDILNFSSHCRVKAAIGIM